MTAVGACGSSTPPPGSGPALTTSSRLAAGPSTSSGRAGSTTRSPPPTSAGIKPSAPVTQWRFTITPDGQPGELAGITRHEHTPATSMLT